MKKTRIEYDKQNWKFTSAVLNGIEVAVIEKHYWGYEVWFRGLDGNQEGVAQGYETMAEAKAAINTEYLH